jgi:hypothetical protein
MHHTTLLEELRARRATAPRPHQSREWFAHRYHLRWSSSHVAARQPAAQFLRLGFQWSQRDPIPTEEAPALEFLPPAVVQPDGLSKHPANVVLCGDPLSWATAAWRPQVTRSLELLRSLAEREEASAA